MFTGLIFTFGSLFFTILLFIVYFSKQRFLSIRNKIYRYMLIVVLILVITEFISTFSVVLFDNDILNFTLYKVHWFTGIVWFSLLYYYSIVFISKIECDSLFMLVKKDKKTKIISIVFIILALIYFVIPFDNLLPDNISYVPGLAAYYIFGFCIIPLTLTVIYLLRNGKDAPIRTKLSVWIMIIEMMIIFALQITYPDIAFSPIGATLQMYFLYFNIENPDLKIIKELEEVNKNIENSSKAKADFLSNMSHEIRTPMNAIVGFSSSLLNKQEFDEETARSDIMHIQTAGNSLLDIINNILDISKIESGNETLEEKEYSLINITMELASIIEARIGKRPIKLIIDVDKNIPSRLYGDSTKIFQILLNILSNAVKYTEVGKIKLTITGDVKNEIIDLHFKVSDTGYGIKKEDFNKLFEKFSRLDSAVSNEIEGTGLGLVITKKYVDLMKGNIWFESEYEVGTTFFVDITQKIISNTKIGEVKETNEIKSDDYLNCSGKKVLVVDDNKLNIKVASRILERYKFDIDTSESGKDAIYKVKSGNDYDIIFLDHMMPEMDGIETMKILKKLDGYNIPPIVALPANAITGVKEMYLNVGYDEYLSKPININELDKIIEKYFKK